jgi:hypothetical protein
MWERESLLRGNADLAIIGAMLGGVAKVTLGVRLELECSE